MMFFRKKMLIHAISFTLLIIIGGCAKKEDQAKFSASIEELENVVDLKLTVENVKWEIFGTPEYSGGVPGPTDYLTLVAEFSSSSSRENNQAYPDTSFFIVPEARRSWLNPHFSKILETSKDTGFDTATHDACSPVQIVVKRNQNPAFGFICSYDETSFLYLTIQDNTSGQREI